MKLKSLILGSLALAGVSGMTAGASAADLAKGVMTSLDVCDALGLSGLTISSDTNCLQITGGVSYMFAWGDYSAGAGSSSSGQLLGTTPDDNSKIPVAGNAVAVGSGLGTATATAQDWDSQIIAWLQVVGTADSDFGPAKVVVKMKSEQYRHTANGYSWLDGDDTGGATTNFGFGETNGAGTGIPANNAKSGQVIFDQAYVSVGDSTILTAGLTGSVANTDDDTPLNYLGLFNASNAGGVLWGVSSSRQNGSIYGNGDGANIKTGGASIQVTSSLGNGITLKGALEDLGDDTPKRAGTAVGVISYAGDNLTAHLTVVAGGILDGHSDVQAYHAGFTGTFDKFKLVGAVAGDSTGYFNGLASAQVGLDLFTLAGAVEFTHNSANATGAIQGGVAGSAASVNGFGAGLSGSLQVSDGVAINLGGRYFDSDTATPNNEFYQVAVSVVAAVTETITLTGELGVYGANYNGNQVPGSYQFVANVPPAPVTTNPVSQTANVGGTWNTVEYGAAAVAWNPGGGFTSSLKGEAYTNGAYRATFNAAKTFQ